VKDSKAGVKEIYIISTGKLLNEIQGKSNE
jgi:hypothetical protein